MTFNERGRGIKSSLVPVQGSGSTPPTNLFVTIGCVALLLVFLISLLLIFSLKSCHGENDKRNIKIQRYQTTDVERESGKIVNIKYLHWYVLKGDDCYYQCVSDVPVPYSEMIWEKVAAFPEYLSPNPRKIPFPYLGRLSSREKWFEQHWKMVRADDHVVEELQYTLIPLCILPKSIQVNMKGRLKEKYELPVPND